MSAGADLLDRVRDFIGRYVALPGPDALTAVTLWAAHSHVVGWFDSSPRLALLSPEPGSGKTRTLEVLELLVPAPMHVLSASPSVIFRSIEATHPTLLFDEVDSIFGRHGKDDGAEDLRALLNAGHRRGATIPRCIGPTHTPHRFPVYGPVALAGLGDLPDTLMSRSVVIRMRRRAPGEQLAPFRRRIVAPIGHALADELDQWTAGAQDLLEDAWPEMPPGVTDRPADVWEALLAVADAAGGHWPSSARSACVTLTRSGVAREASLGVRLLTDLRTVFGDRDRMGTETILKALHDLDESPWSDLRGRPLDARGLARRLGQYEVESTKVRVGDTSVRGYRSEDLWDAWRRYTPDEAEQAEQTEQAPETQATAVPLDLDRSGTVPEHAGQTEHEEPRHDSDVPDVPDVPHPEDPERDPGPEPPPDLDEPPPDVPEHTLDTAPTPWRPTDADLARWEASDTGIDEDGEAA